MDDLQLSVMTPHHAQWILSVFVDLKHKDKIKSGRNKVGLLEVIATASTNSNASDVGTLSGLLVFSPFCPHRLFLLRVDF